MPYGMDAFMLGIGMLGKIKACKYEESTLIFPLLTKTPFGHRIHRHLCFVYEARPMLVNANIIEVFDKNGKML